jgi:hypothetical protein
LDMPLRLVAISVCGLAKSDYVSAVPILEFSAKVM